MTKFRFAAVSAAACVLAVGLSACGTTGLSAANQDAIAAAIAAKSPYCGGTVQLNAGVGGLAGTGTGITNNMQLTCPAQPYPSAAAPAAGAAASSK